MAKSCVDFELFWAKLRTFSYGKHSTLGNTRLYELQISHRLRGISGEGDRERSAVSQFLCAPKVFRCIQRCQPWTSDSGPGLQFHARDFGTIGQFFLSFFLLSGKLKKVTPPPIFRGLIRFNPTDFPTSLKPQRVIRRQLTAKAAKFEARSFWIPSLASEPHVLAVCVKTVWKRAASGPQGASPTRGHGLEPPLEGERNSRKARES